MENEETVQSLAQLVLAQLETRTREATNAEFITFKSNREQWMQDLARAAHFDLLPNDWSYQFISNVLHAIIEYYDSERYDEGHGRDNLEPSIYNHDLISWVGSNNLRADYVDRARTEIGGDSDLMAQLMNGQLLEMQEVYDSVLSSLKERLDE